MTATRLSIDTCSRIFFEAQGEEPVYVWVPLFPVKRRKLSGTGVLGSEVPELQVGD